MWQSHSLDASQKLHESILWAQLQAIFGGITDLVADLQQDAFAVVIAWAEEQDQLDAQPATFRRKGS